MSTINKIIIKKVKGYKMDEISILKARAIYYNLFARFFVYTKDMTHYLELINILNVLKENPLDEASKKLQSRFWNNYSLLQMRVYFKSMTIFLTILLQKTFV